jgi:hypothetical protein
MKISANVFPAARWPFLAACGGGKTVVESDLGIKGAPDWVNKGTQAVNDKDGRLFHGVGSSPALGDDALQRSTADDRARAEVARMLSTYLDVVSSDYSASAGTGSNANADQSVSRQVKAVTKQNLAGSKIIGRWKDGRTNTVYSIAELDFKAVKTTLEGANGMNRTSSATSAQRRKHIRQGIREKKAIIDGCARVSLVALAAVSACATGRRLDESKAVD